MTVYFQPLFMVLSPLRLLFNDFYFTLSYLRSCISMLIILRRLFALGKKERIILDIYLFLPHCDSVKHRKTFFFLKNAGKGYYYDCYCSDFSVLRICIYVFFFYFFQCPLKKEKSLKRQESTRSSPSNK